MTPPRRPAGNFHSIVMIGFGSIDKGTLPLIERHFEYDKERFVIIDPHEDGGQQNSRRALHQQAITKDNYCGYWCRC
jgi:homospermidine synthase